LYRSHLFGLLIFGLLTWSLSVESTNYRKGSYCSNSAKSFLPNKSKRKQRLYRKGEKRPSLDIDRNYGPRLVLKSRKNTIRFDQIPRLRFGSWNVQDFHISPRVVGGDQAHSYPPRIYDVKDMGKVHTIAKMIKEQNLDIVTLQEVGSIDDLRYFNNHYLDGTYHYMLVPGNTPGNHEVGFLIRKTLPFDLELRSFRELKGEVRGRWRRIFTHDLPLLTIKKAQAAKDEGPLMFILGAHLKSDAKAGRNGRSQIRESEIENALNIIRQLQKRYPHTPIILAGDFNGNVINASEFHLLRGRRGMFDSFYVNRTPHRDRVTFVHFEYKDERPQPMQIDGIFVNEIIQRNNILNGVRVVPFRRDNGATIPLPRTHLDKFDLPSDHYLIIADFDIQQILQLYFQRGGR